MNDFKVAILLVLGFLLLVPLSYFAMAEAWYYIHWNIINHEFRMLMDRVMVIGYTLLILLSMVYG